MGTRGIYGYHKNGIDKLTYNHFDSYPSVLGKGIIDYVRKYTDGEIDKAFNKIIMVKHNIKPTKKMISNCKDYTDLGVSNQSINDIYCLLRNSQGDLNPYHKGLLYMIDSKDFIKDSLFCEWGYIINLDTHKLEIYRGFNKTRSINRYCGKSTKHQDGYYPCSLINERYLLDYRSMSNSAIDQFTKHLEEVY